MSILPVSWSSKKKNVSGHAQAASRDPLRSLAQAAEPES